MINIELAAPVLIEKQIDGAAAKNNDIDRETLFRLACGALSIASKDTNEHERGDVLTPAAIDHEGVLTGADAAVLYCGLRGTELKPLSRVEIPVEVYDHCWGRQWMGVCMLAARIERRNDRMRRLLDVKNSKEGFPTIILANEARLLRDSVEDLERNPDHGNGRISWSDGTVVRSLADIGWSLSGGWCESMAHCLECEQKDVKSETAAWEMANDIIYGIQEGAAGKETT